MRPVLKWKPGDSIPSNPTDTVKASYNPYGTAETVLEENLGSYCSYCEVFSSDLDVEHVIPRSQDPSLENSWDNFLLACRRCNGKDNKGTTPVTPSDLYLPHLNNTFYALEYLEGGLVQVHSKNSLTPAQKVKAQKLIDLVKLDKYPGNLKYPAGFPPRDKRWSHRRTAWELAKKKKAQYDAGSLSEKDIVDYAKTKGFFSVWLTIFENDLAVRQKLINGFSGTDDSSFDSATTASIFRNPTNTPDPI